MKSVFFRAPWNAALILLTVLSAGLCFAAMAGGLAIIMRANWLPLSWHTSSFPTWIGWIVFIAPEVATFLSALFMVRGYVITEDKILVQRLGWNSQLPLPRLLSAEADPDALHRSVRLFGNGGYFSFTGIFRNKKLGLYRALATDAKKAVVLRFVDKVVVVTPDDPQKFVAELKPSLIHGS